MRSSSAHCARNCGCHMEARTTVRNAYYSAKERERILIFMCKHKGLTWVATSQLIHTCQIVYPRTIIIKIIKCGGVGRKCLIGDKHPDSKPI